MPSVRGGALLEQGLGLCLGTVRLQQLNKAWGKKEKACQADFPASYLFLIQRCLVQQCEQPQLSPVSPLFSL